MTKELQKAPALNKKEQLVKSELVKMGAMLRNAIEKEDAYAVWESVSIAEQAIRTICPNLFLGNPESKPTLSALFRPLQIAILRARTVGVTSDDLNVLGVHLEEISGRSEGRLIAELKKACQQTGRLSTRSVAQGKGKHRFRTNTANM